MKKFFYWLPAMLLGLGLFAACSEEDDAAALDEKVAVSFELNMSDLTKTLVYDEQDGTNMAECPEPDGGAWFDGTYQAKVFVSYGSKTATPVEHTVNLIKDASGNIRTGEIMMVKPISGASHWLQKILIVKTATPTSVLFATVGATSIYKSHVVAEHLMPMELSFCEGGKLIENSKPVIPVSLLCAVNETSDNFGFAIWGLNFVKVICLDYTVNTPADPCVNNSADIVATTQLKLIKQIKKDGKWVDMLVHEGYSKDGVKGKICFNDQGNIKDEDERYSMRLTVTYTNGHHYVIGGTMTLAQMYDYKCSGFWVIPNGGTQGLLHFNLYGVNLLTVGTAVPHTQDISKDKACAKSNDWDLTVLEAYECPGDCAFDCKVPFLSDFTTFAIPTPVKPTPCDWIVAGVDRKIGYNNMKYLQLGCNGLIKTPVVKLAKGDIINIYYNGSISVDLLPVDATTGALLAVNPESTQQIKDKPWNCIDSYSVKQSGCYRVRVTPNYCCTDREITYPDIYSMTYIKK